MLNKVAEMINADSSKRFLSLSFALDFSFPLAKIEPLKSFLMSRMKTSVNF